MDVRSDVAQAVDRVTSLLHRDGFLWDFVLEKSNAGAALLLTNAEAFRHAVSAAYSDTFSPAGFGDEADYFASHTLAEVLFVPAFSTGRISIGAAVTRQGSAGVGRSCGTHMGPGSKCVQAGGGEAAGSAGLGGHSGVALGRFVRDDASGELLLALRPTDKRDSALVLLHFAHRSTVVRERTMVVFDDTVFASSTLALPEKVTCVQETEETRVTCPVCRAAAADGCNCPVSDMLHPRGPAHPLDYGAIRPTMLSHVGGMAGRGRVISNTAGVHARWCRQKVNSNGSKLYAGPVFEVRSGGNFVASPPLVSWMQICGRAQESDSVANQPRVIKHWCIAGELRTSAIQCGMMSTSPTSAMVSRPANGHHCGGSYGISAGAAFQGEMNRAGGGSSMSGTKAFLDGGLVSPPMSLLNRDGIVFAPSEVFDEVERIDSSSSTSSLQQLQIESPEGIATGASPSERNSRTEGEAGPACSNFEPLIAPSIMYDEWQDADTVTANLPPVTQSVARSTQVPAGPFAVPAPPPLTTADGLSARECATFQAHLPSTSETVLAEEGGEQDAHHANATCSDLPVPEALPLKSTESSMYRGATVSHNSSSSLAAILNCVVDTPASPEMGEDACVDNVVQERTSPAAVAEEAKLQKRRVRNRLAAAKSNQKRKERNDHRKNEKIRLDKRIVELRVMEAKLVTRKEMMLKLLSEQNILVPPQLTRGA